MTERPIYFREPSADAMIRAVLADEKTQHRQPVMPQPKPYAGGVHPWNTRRHKRPYIDSYCGSTKTTANPRGMSANWYWWTEDDRLGPFVGKCPFGVPGDRLWLQECWDAVYHTIHEDGVSGDVPFYRADYEDDPAEVAWRPSIHMPRWTSRITLLVKRVWMERDSNLWVWACEFERVRGSR